MSNPVVLITGALTGIGRATAVAFAKEGAKLVVTGRRRHDDEVCDLVDRTVARFGRLDVFDFARFSYDNVVAEDGHVVAVFNIGVTGTDAIIKIVDHWTLRDGKAISLWAAYSEPQAVLEKLGIKLTVDGGMNARV